MRWDTVTALFGGTFDPPHVGHLQAARGLLTHPGVGRVLVLPAPNPPRKPAIASSADRLEMTRILFADEPEIEISELEMRLFEKSSGPSYTADLLLSVRSEFPHAAFVIGTDQLEALPQWHRFPEILKFAHWIVLERKDGPPSEPAIRDLCSRGLLETNLSIRGSDRKLTVVTTEAPPLSSRSIRETIARHGSPPPGALTPAVETYLKHRRIYGTKAPHE